MAEFGAWLFFHQVDFHIHPPELEGASKSPGSAAGHNGDDIKKIIRLLFCPFTHSRVLCVSIMFMSNPYFSAQPPARGEMGYQDIMRMHPVGGNMAGRRGWGVRGQRSRSRRGRNDFAFNGGGRHDYGGHGAGGNSC